MTNLCHLRLYAEAEDLLPEVRERAIELANQLDLLRVLWLKGKVAAGRGRREEARAAFEQVRREFAARGDAWDTALVSLDLAILDLEEGRNAQARALSAEMVRLLRTQRVHREALAAVFLFRRAIEAETATPELARRLLAYLERARQDPNLRFEEAP